MFASLKTSPLPPITLWFVYHEWNSRFGVYHSHSLSMFSLSPGSGLITPLHLFAASYTNKGTPPHSVFDIPACACLPQSRFTFCCGLFDNKVSSSLFFVVRRLISEEHIKGFMTEVLPSGTVRLSRDSGGVDTHQIWPLALSVEQHGQSKIQEKSKKREWQHGAVTSDCCQMTSGVKNPEADEQKTEIHLFLLPFSLLRTSLQLSPPPKPCLGIPVSIALCQVIRTLIRIFLRQDQGVWVKEWGGGREGDVLL